MTELTDRIVQVVESIPVGRVTTYGAIARAVGTGARVVARVLHGAGHEIPWWRVVSAEGRPYPAAVHAARERFVEEETPVVDLGGDLRVDLERAEWMPARPLASEPC